MENGRIVKKARKVVGLLQSEFAECLEIPIRTLQQWEQGRSMPDYVLKLILFKLEVNGLTKGVLKSLSND